MSTLKSVGQKLFKTELSSHKVDLSVINEFTKAYESALDLQAKAEVNLVNYNKLAASIQTVLNQAGTQFLRANGIYTELENMSKELGVEIPKNVKTKKDIISKAIKEIDSYNKKLSSNKVSI